MTSKMHDLLHLIRGYFYTELEANHLCNTIRSRTHFPNSKPTATQTDEFSDAEWDALEGFMNSGDRR